MTALAGGVSYPAVSFKDKPVGYTVSGRVIDFMDIQERSFGTKEPKFWKDGSPVLQTRVTLEQEPGNPNSRVSLYVGGQRMLRAVAEAISQTGDSDITPQSDLSVTFTGWEPTEQGAQARTYRASYRPFDPADLG